MTLRLDYRTLSAAGMKGFNITHAYLGQCGLPVRLIDLVYLRVSLINGCAYCIDMHTRDLMKHGVPVSTIVLVPVWEEAGSLFSAQEKAALAWAECVTNQSETAVPDAAFAAVSAHFTPKELSDLTVAISLMNAYNRMAVSLRMTPDAVKEAAGA